MGQQHVDEQPNSPSLGSRYMARRVSAPNLRPAAATSSVAPSCVMCDSMRVVS